MATLEETIFQRLAEKLDPPPPPTGWEWVQSHAGANVWSGVEEICEAVQAHRKVAIYGCHSSSKALALDTALPTPMGWTTMGEVQEGDQLLDEQGKPCYVVTTSEVRWRDCFRLAFDDGTSVVASDDHEWQVLDLPTRHRIRVRTAKRGHPLIADWREHWLESSTVTTAQMAKDLKIGGQLRWAVPCARSLNGESTGFPMYSLGAWLGDGTSREAQITIGHEEAPELIAHMEAEGLTVREQLAQRRSGCGGYGLIGGFRQTLKSLNLLNNKHVPTILLRATHEERLALLQGLMDTDGFCCSTGNSVAITLTSKVLSDGVLELLRTLGFKPRRSTSQAKLNGKVSGTAYTISFSPEICVFRLRRKADRFQLTARHRSRATTRSITAIEPVPSVPTKCVQVDSPSHLYLATESFVPTHNTWTIGQLALWWIDSASIGKRRVITTAPGGDQVKGGIWIEMNRSHAAYELPGRINQTEWWIGSWQAGIGRKPPDWATTSFQGLKAEEVLVIIDEATGLDDEIWEALESLASSKHSKIVAMGNPTDPNSTFRRICLPGSGYHVIQIDGHNTPNWTGERVTETVANSLISKEYAQGIIDRYGEDSPIYLARVRGEWPEDASDGVVPYSWLKACQKLGIDLSQGPTELGVDVGASEEGDPTVIYERRGNKAGRKWEISTDDSEKIADLVQDVINETEATNVKVDVIGVGFGVVGSLKRRKSKGEHKANIVGVNVGETPTTKEAKKRFPNKRSQIWWEVGRELSQLKAWDLSAIDEDTVAELIAPRFEEKTNGQIVVEPKKETKKRLGRSPDNADAILLAFYKTGGPGRITSAHTYSLPPTPLS